MKSIAFTEHVYVLPYIPNGSTSAYIDLRKNLAGIENIPELRRESRLKPLVRILNDPGGVFMTHACAVASRKPGIEGKTEIRIPHGAKDAHCWYSSYVIFGFWCLGHNKKNNYETIHTDYPSDRSHYSIAFEVQPAYFTTPYEQSTSIKLADTNGTVCSLWASGWGSNPSEAQDRWSSAIADLIAFFRNLSLPFEPKCQGVTVSHQMFGADPSAN